MSKNASSSGQNEWIGKAIESGVSLIGNIVASTSGGSGGGGGNQPTIVRQTRPIDFGMIAFIGIFLVLGLILIFKK